MSEEITSHRGGSMSDLIRETMEESEDSARVFLRQSWISAANAALRDARYRAGLTQEEVAQRLETTQSAIARLERDFEGRTTLHRFIDYVLACGAMPLSVAVEPFSAVRSYVIANPEADRGEASYCDWIAKGAAVPSVYTKAASFSTGWPMDTSGTVNWSVYRGTAECVEPTAGPLAEAPDKRRGGSAGVQQQRDDLALARDSAA